MPDDSAQVLLCCFIRLCYKLGDLIILSIDFFISKALGSILYEGEPLSEGI